MIRRIVLSLVIVAAVASFGASQAEARHCSGRSYSNYGGYRTVRYYSGPSYYRGGHYGHRSYYGGHHGGYYGGHHGGGIYFSFGH